MVVVMQVCHVTKLRMTLSNSKCVSMLTDLLLETEEILNHKMVEFSIVVKWLCIWFPN